MRCPTASDNSNRLYLTNCIFCYKTTDMNTFLSRSDSKLFFIRKTLWFLFHLQPDKTAGTQTNLNGHELIHTYKKIIRLKQNKKSKFILIPSIQKLKPGNLKDKNDCIAASPLF